MAMAMMKSGLQASLRRGRCNNPPKRSFASSAHHDDAYEAEKWEKITYLGIATCSVLAIYNLSKGHPHYEEPPPYPYLRVRHKDFPWGPDSLIERMKKKEKKSHHLQCLFLGNVCEYYLVFKHGSA